MTNLGLSINSKPAVMTPILDDGHGGITVDQTALKRFRLTPDSHVERVCLESPEIAENLAADREQAQKALPQTQARAEAQQQQPSLKPMLYALMLAATVVVAIAVASVVSVQTGPDQAGVHGKSAIQGFAFAQDEH